MHYGCDVCRRRSVLVVLAAVHQAGAGEECERAARRQRGRHRGRQRDRLRRPRHRRDGAAAPTHARQPRLRRGRPERLARGETRQQDADERLREPHLQVL